MVTVVSVVSDGPEDVVVTVMVAVVSPVVAVMAVVMSPVVAVVAVMSPVVAVVAVSGGPEDVGVTLFPVSVVFFIFVLVFLALLRVRMNHVMNAIGDDEQHLFGRPAEAEGGVILGMCTRV